MSLLGTTFISTDIEIIIIIICIVKGRGRPGDLYVGCFVSYSIRIRDCEIHDKYHKNKT